MEHAFYQIDVRHLASKVTAPTLVLHARQDACIPLEEGRLLASMIPGSRFVQLESRNHVLIEQEPAWGRFLAEVRTFLAEGVVENVQQAPSNIFPELTPRERLTLELIAHGLDNQQIAERVEDLLGRITSLFRRRSLREHDYGGRPGSNRGCLPGQLPAPGPDQSQVRSGQPLPGEPEHQACNWILSQAGTDEGKHMQEITQTKSGSSTGMDWWDPDFEPDEFRRLGYQAVRTCSTWTLQRSPSNPSIPAWRLLSTDAYSSAMR